MEINELETKVKDWFSKSAKASKAAFEKAGDKVQDFTDKSVLKVEKRQLESKRENLYLELGVRFSSLMEKGFVPAIDNEKDKDWLNKIQTEITSLNTQILEKEKEISE